MGNKNSSPPPSPPPPPRPPPSPPMLPTAWRTLSWGNNDSDRQYALDYQPHHEGVTQLRVLLYGPVGAGKSSFINSIRTALLQKHCAGAGTGTIVTTEGQSFTKTYQTHRIRKTSKVEFSFVFNDIMGIEEGSGRGVHVEDIKLAMKGHVKENYKFNPASPLRTDDPDYVHSPSPNNKVHILVCVCSANASEIKESVLQKMREIREEASFLGIPQLLILTKVDDACPVTQDNLRDVYRSKHVKRKMAELSSKVGIPMNVILPVKNYSHEISPRPDVDTLILSVLRLIINFGDEFLDKL